MDAQISLIKIIHCKGPKVDPCGSPDHQTSQYKEEMSLSLHNILAQLPLNAAINLY
jgi:hypothetical protein